MKDNQSMSHSDAIKRMRQLTSAGIPFSFGFITCNTTDGKSKGYRVIDKGILRSGLRSNQSDKSDILIAYIDCDDASEDKNRFFYYPLLMMFNGLKVQP